jgi:hypothetical protein
VGAGGGGQRLAAVVRGQRLAAVVPGQALAVEERRLEALAECKPWLGREVGCSTRLGMVGRRGTRRG